MSNVYGVRMIPLDTIVIPENHRPVDSSAIPGLVESISKLGLRAPITVRLLSELPLQVLLLGGAHRLAAYRELGLAEIAAVFVDDPLTAKLVGRTDNLHRVELTVQQRAEELAVWLEDCKSIPGQVDQVTATGGRGVRGGTAEAARRVGVNRSQARRAKEIAAMAPAAKIATADLGLADNQSALLEVARARGADAQVEKARDLARKGKKEAANVTTPEQEFSDLLKVWKRCRPAVRARFVSEVIAIDQPRNELSAEKPGEREEAENRAAQHQNT